jgi:hypothetical protein
LLKVALSTIKQTNKQTKDDDIGICRFSAKQAALRIKSKDWLAWSLDNVSRVEQYGGGVSR